MRISDWNSEVCSSYRSAGELRRAVAAGIAPGKIVFSGVGKTADEMRLALDLGIFQFNLESEPEAEMLSEVALAMGKVAPVAYRITPDVDAGPHEIGQEACRERVGPFV